MRSKILVLGSGGQVGRAWLGLGDHDNGIRGLDYPECDFKDLARLEKLLGAQDFDILVNTAAYTAVDQAQVQFEEARLINARAPEMLARFCKRNGKTLVHYSTDYVYGDSGDRPLSECSQTSPLNVYAQTKLEGDEAVLAGGGRNMIFRTSWVYDAFGKNFFNTILKLGSERKELNVVDDQVGAPTYAPNLAYWSQQALVGNLKRKEFISDVFHLCAAGEVSWYGFAKAIFAGVRRLGVELELATLKPIRTDQYPTSAPRQLNSRLSLTKIYEAFQIRTDHWSLGLESCFKEWQFKARS